jgi:hypothetical protein
MEAPSTLRVFKNKKGWRRLILFTSLDFCIMYDGGWRRLVFFYYKISSAKKFHKKNLKNTELKIIVSAQKSFQEIPLEL